MTIGQNFYLKKTEEEFSQNVLSWLNFLGIEDIFPNFEDFQDHMYEIGDKLRDFGKTKISGFAGKTTNSIFFRPGDYAALLHEINHNNPKYQDRLLTSEAGAFGIEIFTTGDFEGTIKNLLYSRSYKERDKTLCRWVSEASLVAGRYVFDVLKEVPFNTPEDQVLLGLNDMVTRAEEEFIKSQMSPEDYLVNMHGLTPFVAEYLVKTTQDTRDTIVRSTSQTKKEVIGAFKTLASFYHINLNYPLAEALNRTEELFERDEALTIHKTLTKGAKDVFAKMIEYGYDIETCRGIAETMITQGASKARMFTNGLPSFLELTGSYGPRGEEVLNFALNNPYFLESIIFTDGSKSLLKLAEDEPEQVPRILSEFSKMRWDRRVQEGHVNFWILYESKGIKMIDLTPEEKAKLAAHSFYIVTQKRDKDYGINTAGHTSTTFDALLEREKTWKVIESPPHEEVLQLEEPEEEKPKSLLKKLFSK